jgi:uncharacterized protein
MIVFPPSVVSARQARPMLMVGGVDIIAGVSGEHILAFSYVDNTTDNADGVELAIADPNRTWLQTYMPEEGIECEPMISVSNWRGPFDFRTLECGTFWIDEINFAGPPNAIKLKANSAPVTQGIKDTKKNKAWDSSDIQTVGEAIASENGLTFVYDVEATPEKVKRTDQVDKSDLEYYRNKCKDAGLSLKICKKQLVVYSEKEYEAREPSFVFTYGASNLLSWDFVLRLNDVYAEAEAAYVNPETGKLTKVKVAPKDVPKTKAKLQVNERLDYGPNDLIGGGTTRRPSTRASDFKDWTADDPADNNGKGKGGQKAATNKAEKKLHEKNKKNKCWTLEVVGDPMYLSGLTCLVFGFGPNFDDKYFIETVAHDIGSSGYKSKLRLRKAISEY